MEANFIMDIPNDLAAISNDKLKSQHTASHKLSRDGFTNLIEQRYIDKSDNASSAPIGVKCRKKGVNLLLITCK